jgi:lysophospholipase L1-like esterase
VNAEDAALAVFFALPVAAGWAAWRYVRRLRGTKPVRRQLVVGNALVLAFLVTLAALAGELWFRFGWGGTDSFGMLRATKRWFARHSVKNNANVRDDIDYALGAAPEGKRRITFVGDSFTAGHGVPDVADRFANRVRAARSAWEVHVLAENGIDTAQETAVLRRAPPEYQFDVVVLVYGMNDIGDLLPETHAFARKVAALRADRGALAESSSLCDVLRFLAIRASDPDVRGYFPAVRAAYDGPDWDTQRARLREMRHVVTSRGGRLAVVTFPFLHERIGDDDAFAAAHAKLAEHWRAEQVPHLDLRDAFRGRDPDDLVAGAWDAHPNEAAHALAADAILPFLDRVTSER